MQWSCSVSYTILHKHVCCVASFYLRACASICRKSLCRSFFPPGAAVLCKVRCIWFPQHGPVQPNDVCGAAILEDSGRLHRVDWRLRYTAGQEVLHPASWLWADVIGNAVYNDCVLCDDRDVRSPYAPFAGSNKQPKSIVCCMRRTLLPTALHVAYCGVIQCTSRYCTTLEVAYNCNELWNGWYKVDHVVWHVLYMMFFTYVRMYVRV